MEHGIDHNLAALVRMRFIEDCEPRIGKAVLELADACDNAGITDDTMMALNHWVFNDLFRALRVLHPRD